MGWLRLVGSLKLQVSFADYSRFYRALLQKRSTILRRLRMVGTPQASSHGHVVLLCLHESTKYVHICLRVLDVHVKSNYVYIYVYILCLDAISRKSALYSFYTVHFAASCLLRNSSSATATASRASMKYLKSQLYSPHI